MKKFFLFGILILSMLSCGLDDEKSLNYYNEVLPIENVTMPDSFQYGHTHEIILTYLRPTGCHLFSDFYYINEENQRTIAVITTVFPDQDCQPLDNEEVEVSFNFHVTHTEPYIFRFWQGEDDNGNDTYYIVEIPVTEED